jgi:hypothetical protein
VIGAHFAESKELQIKEDVICQVVKAVRAGLVVCRDRIWPVISEDTLHCPALQVTYTDTRVVI